MSAGPKPLATAIRDRVSPMLAAPGVAFILCYAIGLIATRTIGHDPTGLPLLALGAPAAVGVLVRMGVTLEAADPLRLAAVHLAVGFAFGDAFEPLVYGALRDVAQIAVAVLLFRSLRSRGELCSPITLMAAVVLVSLAGPFAALALDVAREVAAGDVALRPLVGMWVVDAVSMAAVLGVAITRGRQMPIGPEADGAEEARPRLWEYPAAAALVFALVSLAFQTGRPEPALAASVALLWFALRLGLFATMVAASCFAVLLLGFGAAGLWPPMLRAENLHDDAIIRYVTVVLLASPSVLFATVAFEQRRLRRIFAYRARHDGLTTLVNRSRFLELLDKATGDARLRQGRFLLLLIDLDHFKSVNDTYGHACGDQLLVAVAARLRGSMRSTDMVARLGGDEFAAIVPLSTLDDAMRLTKRLVEAVDQDCELDGVVLRPSVTVGAVLSPDSSTSPERLMLLADEALYKAKAAGRNCWRFAATEEAATPTVAWRPGDAAEVETVFLD